MIIETMKRGSASFIIEQLSFSAEGSYRVTVRDYHDKFVDRQSFPTEAAARRWIHTVQRPKIN